MPFPFSIKYADPLTEKIDAEDYPMILKYISSFIINKPVKDIVIENNRLNFNSGDAGKGSVMTQVDKGVFFLKEEEGHVILTYEIFLNKIFIMSSIITVIMGVASQRIWVGFLVFLWVYGINWAVALSRNRTMLDDLVSGINALIKEKSL